MGGQPTPPQDPQQPSDGKLPGDPAQGWSQEPYQQGPYQQGPYQQGPYQQGPYQQGPYQPQGPGWPGQPPIGGPPSSGRQGIIIALSVVIVLGLIAAVAVVVVAWGRGGGEVALGPGEIFLEPAAAIGPEPFTDTFAAEQPPIELAQTAPEESSTVEAPAGVQVRSDDAGEPGLYGGTRNQSSCNPQQLTDFLMANSAKSAAWVQALNSDPTLRWSGGSQVAAAQIPSYITELTPVTLRSDTRVTNHGFSGGRPTPRQAVLQAGTAVLIDQYGVPRIRCACGNPLIPPRPVATTPVYTGRRWPTFNPTNVVIIQQTTTIITTITITDIRNGEPFDRPTGTTGEADVDMPSPGTVAPTDRPTLPPDVVLGTGHVQVTLLWTTGSDLDLHVTDPFGDEVYFGSRSVPSGGQLDRDEIPGCTSGVYAENVFWPDGSAPSGQYEAYVRHFSGCGTPADYLIEVRVDGQLVTTDAGTVQEGEESPPITFTVP